MLANNGKTSGVSLFLKIYREEQVLKRTSIYYYDNVVLYWFVCFIFRLIYAELLQEKRSLYTSPEEFQRLIKQVLSWDIRSVSQRTQNEESSRNANNEEVSVNEYRDTIYHLNLEGLDVAYRITFNSNVLVEDVTISPNTNIPSN